MPRFPHLILLSLLLMLGGCKIVIVVPPYHGALTGSLSGAYNCSWEDGKCEIDVVDLFFDETFATTANFGYEFIRWKIRDRGLCGGNEAECRLYTSGLEGQDKLLAILESDQVFYLEAEVAPLRGRADQMNTVGLWRTEETRGECSASYTLEVWIEPDVGLFTQAVVPAEAILVQQDGSCRVVVAGASRARGPMRAIQQPLVTQAQLRAGWQSVSPGTVASVLGSDSWQLVGEGPVSDRRVQVFTRQ